MKPWLNTIRWKNILIIWLSIVVIISPHFQPERLQQYTEFILWGIICMSVAAIGNISNDLRDVKQDELNKKPNIFIHKKNRKNAYFFMGVFLLITLSTCFYSRYFSLFLPLALVSLLLLFIYNIFLKKVALLGNLIIAFLTALIFIGVDVIVSSRLIYFKLGFENKQIELLAGFSFVTTLAREMIKDAEDRQGDNLAGLHTLAKFFNDTWIGIIMLVLSIAGSAMVYRVMAKRQVHFVSDFYLYAGWTLLITLVSFVFMLTGHPKKYVWASRIMKGGMLGCLVIYLYVSL
jgi:4-hydroxybenzoate polyprenyltransferase